MVAQKNFEFYQGTDLEFSVYYAIDGVAQDLTDYAVRMDIAPFGPSGAPGRTILSLNSEDFAGSLDEPGPEDNEITLDDNGQIHIKISRGLTYEYLRSQDLVAVFAYDLFIRNKITNTQRPLLQGTISVTRAVTQWA